MSTIVKLNVGGQIFQTTKSTLTKFDGFFKTMLETDVPVTRDENNNYFIDRSPRHFELLLNFMRDGGDVTIIPATSSKQEILEIQKEAQYYLLEGLVELCASRILEIEQSKISKVPEENSKKLQFIENDNHLMQLIANIEDKPLLIVFFSLEDDWFDFPRDVNLQSFTTLYDYRFDIYFKCNKPNEKDEDGDNHWFFKVYDRRNGLARINLLENHYTELEKYWSGRKNQMKRPKKIVQRR